ncbi:hypothetical protein GCM10023189_10690 [Nibrella saemangeumensis]|uniref:RNA polymerase sigma-70 factor, ECF subfamily n=1 Tax=Nibrella saemangeumensis TaxID=1084526 RepID=A0ABP8MI34_9BACT
MGVFSRRLTDNDIIEGIKAGGSRRRHSETALYERYAYLVHDGSRKHKLSQEDCASGYSDTVLSVIDHIITGRFEGRSSLKTYVYQIFTNKCVDLLRKNATNRSSIHNTLSLDDAILQVPDQARPAIQRLMDQYDSDLLQQRIRLLSDKCREMLVAWADGYTDEDIAKTLGYNSSDVAKTSRLRCLERLRDFYRGKKS